MADSRHEPRRPRGGGDEHFDGLEFELPPPSRGLGCRLGFLRHLLITRRRSAEELGRLVRAIPGLEDFLIEGVNRASAGRQAPVRRFEDILERWGSQRTEHAVAVFERKTFRSALCRRAS